MRINAALPPRPTSVPPPKTGEVATATNALPQPVFDMKPKSFGFGDGINRLVSAGHGRYLCVQCARFDALYVLDLTAAKGVAQLKVSRDAILAGYADGLIVITPAENKLEVFSTPDFKLAQTSTDPRWRKVCEASAGFASRGPLWTVYEGVSGKPAGIQLLNLSTLKPLIIESARRHAGQEDELSVGSEGRIGWPFQGEAMPLIRAAGVGSIAIFTDFSKPKVQQFIVQLTAPNRVSIHVDTQQQLQDARLFADGKRIAFLKGLISAELTEPYKADYCIPSLEANCYIGFTSRSGEHWEVRDSTTHAVLATLPALGRTPFGYFFDPTHGARTRPEAYISEKLFVLPSIGVYAAVPTTNDKIVIQRFQLDVQPTAPLQPISTAPAAPAAPKYRLWTDASGKFQIEATIVSSAAGQVQLLRKDGKQITIPLDRLSQMDQEYLRGSQIESKTP